MVRHAARFTLVLTTLISMTGAATAAKFNKVVDIGDEAYGFENLEGTDGKRHSLSDYDDAKAVVLIFSCNHCPVARAYEERYKAFQKKYGEKDVQLIAVSCSLMKTDSLEEMKEHAKEREFNFPYLHDGSQTVGKKYGALVTPHVFVLDADRKIAYMGAFDDSMIPSKIEKHYVIDAVDALLAGERPEITESRQFGCRIDYEKNR